MKTYGLYLNNIRIATIEDTNEAYEAYDRAWHLAIVLDQTASLVWDDTAEVVACSYHEDFEPDE